MDFMYKTKDSKIHIFDAIAVHESIGTNTPFSPWWAYQKRRFGWLELVDFIVVVDETRSSPKRRGAKPKRYLLSESAYQQLQDAYAKAA